MPFLSRPAYLEGFPVLFSTFSSDPRLDVGVCIKLNRNKTYNVGMVGGKMSLTSSINICFAKTWRKNNKTSKLDYGHCFEVLTGVSHLQHFSITLLSTMNLLVLVLIQCRDYISHVWPIPLWSFLSFPVNAPLGLYHCCAERGEGPFPAKDQRWWHARHPVRLLVSRRRHDVSALAQFAASSQRIVPVLLPLHCRGKFSVFCR